MGPPEAVLPRISPLTKVSKTGEVYTRRPEVETQLRELAAHGFALNRNALSNRDRKSDGYIYDETLVYLFRLTRENGDEDLLNELYIELDRRVGRLIGKFHELLFADNPEGFDDFKQDIAMALLKKLLDTDSNKADYAQVNFGDYVTVVANDRKKAEIRRLRQRPALFGDLRPWKEEDTEPVENTFRDGRPRVDDALAARAAIAQIPDNIKLAAVMYFLDGWQIESNSPHIATISGYFNVSGRTVRNWLAEARRILSEQGWNG